MSRRGATVTQADVRRIIRAARAEGLPIRGIAARPDGVWVVDTGDAPVTTPAPAAEPRKKIVL